MTKPEEPEAAVSRAFDFWDNHTVEPDPFGAVVRIIQSASSKREAELARESAELRAAWAKRTGTVEVTGDNELPYLKVYFDTVAAMRAFNDTCRTTLGETQ